MAEENSGDSTTEKVWQTPHEVDSADETRNFRKIIFTNAPKIRRKSHNKRSVRRTCEELVASFYPETEVSYEALRLKLITSFDRCDKKTVLAYLGRLETRQKETIEHTVNYLKSGVITNKQHTFIHKYPAKKGYLEVFGFAALHTDSKTGKLWFRLFHYEQKKIDSPLRIPPHESSALKESDNEFKVALAEAKRQIRQSCPNKNSLSVNSVREGSVAESPVLQANVNDETRDGDRERAIEGERKFEVGESIPDVNNKVDIDLSKSSESNLSVEEKRLFRALDSSCREASH